MEGSTRPSGFFVAGGTLRPDIPSYVERPTDDELFQATLTGEYCYVLTPRQMGKSSLMVRTARRLEEQGIATAIVDLTRIGSNTSIEQWYLSLLNQLTRRLRLHIRTVDWWQERSELSNAQRFINFMREVVLDTIEGSVVVFIDEIDATLGLDWKDEFFAAIRALYNARSEDVAFEQLCFVLLGVASPPDLIRDTARTPFNIGRGIVLQEFSWYNVRKLQEGLEAVHPGHGELILRRILYWTHGHPYLTQRLCLAAAESRKDRWSDNSVDEMVESLFLADQARKETNLQFVQTKILNHPHRRQLLALYRKIVKGKNIRDDVQSPIQSQLKLSGIVKAEHGSLRIRNRIYGSVFGQSWVREHTQINLTAALAGVMTAIALLAVGVLAYNYWVTSRCDYHYRHYLEADTSHEQLEDLASMFRLREAFGQAECNSRAQRLFFSTPLRKDQLDLFAAKGAPDRDVTVVVESLYWTLADVDETDSTRSLLVQMRASLDPSRDGTLCQEIDYWLDARESVEQEQFEQARDQYSHAIASDTRERNAATRYERARIYARLSEYSYALRDLDSVVRIAVDAKGRPQKPGPQTPTIDSKSAATGTPTRKPTLIYRLTRDLESTLPPTSTTNPASTTGPTFTPTPTPAPTPTSEAITSPFADLAGIIGAVEKLISSDQGLRNELAKSPNSYPYLREYGLVRPTPTLSPTQTASSTPASFTTTPTPTKSLQIESSATPTSMLGPTTTPASAVSTPKTTLYAIVSRGLVRLRNGPGIDYGVAATVTGGTELPVVGRNAAGDWLQVVHDEQLLWVLRDLVDVPSGTDIPIAQDTPAVPAPLLLEPEPGAALGGAQVVRFKFIWTRRLEGSESFSVYVGMVDGSRSAHWRFAEGDILDGGGAINQTGDRWLYEINFDLRSLPSGEAYWTVVVIRESAGSTQQVSEPSENRRLFVESVRPTPTLTPTATETPLPTPFVQVFDVQPREITEGESVSVNWVVTNVPFISISGVGTTLPTSGNTISVPQETTSYVLYAENEAGDAVSMMITVKVNPRPGATPPSLVPVLLAPPDGASFTGWNAELVLTWTSVGNLAADEYYVVRIPYNEAGDVAEFWRKETTLRLPSNLSLASVGFPDRHYDWSVQVMRCSENCSKVLDDQANKQGVSTSEKSATRTFYWHPDIGGQPSATKPPPGVTPRPPTPTPA